MDDISELLKLVDAAIILAVLGVSYPLGMLIPEGYRERWMPVVPLLLGVGAGLIMTPSGAAWQAVAKSCLLYAAAPAYIYKLGKTTLFAK